MTQFSSKWGNIQDAGAALESGPRIELSMTIQFVCIVLILVLVRPSFVMTKTSRLRVASVSLVYVVLIAALTVVVTYMYPIILKP